MPFSPRQEYEITPLIVRLKDFHDFREAYITRPPYQRKSSGSKKRNKPLWIASSFCKACKAEGKSDGDATIPWKEYDADHVVPHSRGGTTSLGNAQLLCRHHNQRKSAKVA